MTVSLPNGASASLKVVIPAIAIQREPSTAVMPKGRIRVAKHNTIAARMSSDKMLWDKQLPPFLLLWTVAAYALHAAAAYPVLRLCAGKLWWPLL